MKLRLENIGKIKKAAVEIQGITVISGENNTGKSTLGKALFSSVNACSSDELGSIYIDDPTGSEEKNYLFIQRA